VCDNEQVVGLGEAGEALGEPVHLDLVLVHLFAQEVYLGVGFFLAELKNEPLRVLI
jgi:hypothetical protein